MLTLMLTKMKNITVASFKSCDTENENDESDS